MQNNLVKMMQNIECIVTDEFGSRLIIKDGENVYRLGIFPSKEDKGEGSVILQDVTEDVDEIFDVQVETCY